MKEVNMSFYTDVYADGYQLGFNIKMYKSLTSNEYNMLCTNISCIFKMISYDMDIVKITEIFKTILENNNIKDEDILDLQISIINRKDETQSKKIKYVERGRLPHQIKGLGLANNREVIIVRYNKNELINYTHENISERFVYSNNSGFNIDCQALPESSKKRNTFVNKFFKTNLENLKKLENIQVDQHYSNINYNDNILITVYKYFYGERPNFDEPYIYEKIQSMVAIVDTSVMEMLPSISNHNYYNPDIEFPESQYIKEQIFRINLVLGNDTSRVLMYNLKPKLINKIVLLGESIRNYIKPMTEEEKVEFLKIFSVNYLHTHSFYHQKSIEEIDERSQELMRLLTKNDTKN